MPSQKNQPPPLIKEETPFLNTYKSRREQKPWLYISSRLKPGTVVLAKASSNLTD
jgi:hypothetical protein